MKTKFLRIGALCFGSLACAAPAVAQNALFEEVSVTEYSCENANHYYSNWRNNWFINFGAGINQPFVEQGVKAKSDLHTIDKTKMTATYNFGFGRWMSPYLGWRINAIGGSLHWDNPTLEEPANGWTKARHVNVNFELMWDMFNSLGGVNADRVFSIVPFVGLGGDYTWRVHDRAGQCAAATNINGTGDKGVKEHSWTLTVTAGLQFRLRLCKNVDFFAEARASFYGDNWNLCSYGDPIEANVAALGGFNINFGGRGWDNFNDCAYVGRIADLNNQVNQLRGALAAANGAINELQAQLPCPEAKTVVKEVVTSNDPLLATVRFNLDSAEILPTEEVNIFNMAQWLKDNPKENIRIIGYADRDTGTPEYNLELSQRRADAVANVLVNKYGISRNRFTVSYDGSNSQPYSTNDWNRIVIFTQQK